MAAGPKVRSMAAAAVHAGLLGVGQAEERLEAWTRRVEEAFLGELDELERVKAEDFLRRARLAADAQWRDVVSGSDAAGTPAPTADAVYVASGERAAARLADTHDGAAGDPEGRGRSLSGPRLQKELAKLQDCTRLRALEDKLRRQCNWAQLDRLKELRDPEVSHDWLWHLDPRTGSVLAVADYVANVQKRLGGRSCEAASLCRLCGAQLDPQLEHAEICSTAEATRGHYACVRAVIDGIRLADPGATTEPQGLTSTQTRPADILTTAAVPGRSAALDVCIASPNAAGARGDAVEAAFARKLRHYRREIPELLAAGIVYRPLVWSADGRPHPAATRTLWYAANQAARRGGEQADAKALRRRWKHEVQIAILRRRAALARAVQPRPTSRATWLLTGHADEASADGRAEPIEEDTLEEVDEDSAGGAEEARAGNPGRADLGAAREQQATAPADANQAAASGGAGAPRDGGRAVARPAAATDARLTWATAGRR